MCYGENSAQHASHYVNSQLKALWENAVECARHHGSELAAEETHRYAYALAQFSFGRLRNGGVLTPGDFQFFAEFATPELEFACNHDVILHLRVTEGHYRSDIRSSSSAYVFGVLLVGFVLTTRPPVLSNSTGSSLSASHSEHLGSKEGMTTLGAGTMLSSWLCWTTRVRFS